jgi:hypothetical protein
MNRDEILSDAILREPHPKYGKLTYGRFSRIQKLTAGIGDDDTALANGIAWVICTREKNAPELVAALATEAPVEALRDLFEEEMHATEATSFLAWFNAEIGAADAASTTSKEETGPGK